MVPHEGFWSQRTRKLGMQVKVELVQPKMRYETLVQIF